MRWISFFQDDLVDAAKIASGEAVPAVMQKPISKRGDIWCLGSHRVGCGDAKDMTFILQLVSGDSIRLCLTDVPYGVAIVGHVTSSPHRDFVEGGAGTTKAELRALFDASFRVIYHMLVDGGIFMSFIDWRSIESMLAHLHNMVLRAGNAILARSRRRIYARAETGIEAIVGLILVGLGGRLLLSR